MGFLEGEGREDQLCRFFASLDFFRKITLRMLMHEDLVIGYLKFGLEQSKL